MTDNLNTNENLIPYKEIAKKEHWSITMPIKRQQAKKEKNDINSYLLKIKRSY